MQEETDYYFGYLPETVSGLFFWLSPCGLMFIYAVFPQPVCVLVRATRNNAAQ